MLAAGVLAVVACDVEGLPGCADGNEGYGAGAVAGEFVVGSACFVCDNGVEWPVDVDFEAFRCERGGQVFCSFNEDDGVVAGVG